MLELNEGVTDLSQMYISAPLSSPLLQDYLTTVSNVFGGVQEDIAGLYNLINPYTCPDQYLPYLAANIGLNPRVLSYRTNTINYFGSIFIDTNVYAFGNSSAFFEGNGYLSITPCTYLNFQGGAWTIEFLINFATISGKAMSISQYQDANNYLELYYGASSLVFNFVVAGVTYSCVSTSWTPTIGVWYNIAVQQSGSTYTLFINGQSVATGTQTEAIPLFNGNIFIGQYGTGIDFFTGHMQELRISNVARYPSGNYLPMGTEFISDLNTLLLCHFTGTYGSTSFVDISYAYYQRLQLINAIPFFEIKGTYESLQYLAYFIGLNISVLDFWCDSSSDYNAGIFSPQPWFVDTTGSSYPNGLSSNYFKTPHIGIYILLNQVYGYFPNQYLWNDAQFPDLQFFVDLDCPVHIVPHYFIELSPQAYETGGTIVSPGNIYSSSVNWVYSSGSYDTGLLYDGTYTFSVNAVTTSPTAGATYTNNGVTFTVVSTSIASGFGTISCSGSGVPTTSGTLTKTSGTGDSTINFSAYAVLSYDNSYTAFINSITHWQLGTGNINSTNPPTGIAGNYIQTPVLSSASTGISAVVQQYTTYNTFTVTIPATIIRSGITEFALYTSNTFTNSNAVFVAYFPSILKTGNESLVINVIVLKGQAPL